MIRLEKFTEERTKKTELITRINMNKNLQHVLLIIGLLISGVLTAQDGGERISLNGTWKFYTIYGEGSNYMNIRETEEDLVIDNTDPNIEIRGSWKMIAAAERDSKFHGKDYLQHYFALTDLNGGDKNDSSYVRFYPNFKKAGYFEVFTKFPFSSHLTAQYNVKHAQGVATKYVSQRTYCNEWVSLGIFDFDSADKNYVELTAIVSGAVAADAVMFREIPEEKYVKAKEEPKRVRNNFV